MNYVCVLDDVQSKITIQINGKNYDNVYLKEFVLTNTTNKDYEKFNVIFTFDSSAKVLECHSESKEGFDWQKISRHNSEENKAVATVKNFNRKDTIKYIIRVANITNNKCDVIESGSIGFRIRKK